MRPASSRIERCCFLLVVFLASAKAGSDECSSTTYSCPNCENDGVVTDCLDCEGYLNTDIDHKMCIDRRLFQSHNTDANDHEDHYHFLWNDLVGAVVWFFTAGIAMACGVGGGGIYVPLGILLFQFAPKPASGLSQSSIFGASLGGLLLNSQNRHPNESIRDDPGVENEEQARTLLKEITPEEQGLYLEGGGKFYTRPLIHYDMALFLAPMEMAGAVLGVLVQKLLPNWLYLLIAGLVLSFTSYKTYKKFFDTRSKEKKMEAETREEEEKEEENSNPAAPTEGEDTNPANPAEDNASPEDAAKEEGSAEDRKQDGIPPEAAVMNETGQDNGQELGETPADSEEDKALRQEYLEEDARQYPKEKVVALVLLWIGLFILTLMKGGKGVDSIVGIECDSPVFPVLIVCQFLWLFGFALFFGVKLVINQQARVAVKYPYLADDPNWTWSSLKFYSGFTFIAGIVAGLIGIGGGMVLGPLMLIMGIHPRVSSATTATMIVLTSSSVAVIFVTSGLIHWSYAVFYFVVCLFGALVGKSRIDTYVKKTGRASLLICILATIIALATLGCFVILLTRLADNDWCFDGFNEFCSTSDDEVCQTKRMLGVLAGYVTPQA